MALFRKIHFGEKNSDSADLFKRHLMYSAAQQIIQNLIFFAGLVFSYQILNIVSVINVSIGFILLNAISYSIVYIAGIVSRERGEWQFVFMSLHGKIPLWPILTIAAALSGSFLINRIFGFVMLAYAITALAHDLFFQKKIILDVIILAMEFSLKAAGGVEALEKAELSPWLIACTFLLSIVVSLGKRRNEMEICKMHPDGGRARSTGYSSELLDQMMAVVTSSAFLAYTLYTFSARTRAILGNSYLLYTVPFVLFGILRFLYLVYRGDLTHGAELEILKDRPMLINILLWAAAVSCVLALS